MEKYRKAHDWKINKLYDIQSPRFARAGLELDDLKQLAFFALIAAVEAYDPQKSYAFSSYISFITQHNSGGFGNTEQQA